MCLSVRECSFEKCWGGGGAGKWGGGPCKFRIGFGGGQVNSVLDLGWSCKFRKRGKKPVTLHFYTFLFLYNTRQETLSGIASRGGGG